jgi:hypothetical protein
MTKRKKMRRLVVIAAALIVTATAAVAQSLIPDLKGTWKGTGKILLFGTTEHLTGSPQNAVVRDLEVTQTSRRSGRPADLGHDVICEQRQQGTVRVGAVAGQQNDRGR